MARTPAAAKSAADTKGRMPAKRTRLMTDAQIQASEHNAGISVIPGTQPSEGTRSTAPLNGEHATASVPLLYLSPPVRKSFTSLHLLLALLKMYTATSGSDLEKTSLSCKFCPEMCSCNREERVLGGPAGGG